MFQTAGGAGAFRLASTFMTDQLGMDTVYVANPTWCKKDIRTTLNKVALPVINSHFRINLQLNLIGAMQ